MFSYFGEWLLATAWVFLGDPTSGEIRAWSGTSSAAPRVLTGLVDLRALGADRARGLWVAHGSPARSLARAEIARTPWGPRAVRVQRLELALPIRALATGAGASCVALLESGALALVRAEERGLAVAGEEAWPPLQALASDARGALLLASEDGALHRVDAGDLRFAAARRVAAPGAPIEALAWCEARACWLAVESGGAALRCLDRAGAEHLRLVLPFPALAATGTSSRLWVASASENFVASVDLGSAQPLWRAEEVPPGDLRALFARGSRVVAIGSTRWAWRRRGAWLAAAGGPGLCAVEQPL